MSIVSSFYVRSIEHKYVKWHKAPCMLAKAVSTAFPPLGCRRLKLARANEVLEGHGRDLDNPGQGGFGDLFLQEQCNFRLLAIELGFAQGPLGAIYMKLSVDSLHQCDGFVLFCQTFSEDLRRGVSFSLRLGHPTFRRR